MLYVLFSHLNNFGVLAQFLNSTCISFWWVLHLIAKQQVSSIICDTVVRCLLVNHEHQVGLWHYYCYKNVKKQRL